MSKFPADISQLTTAVIEFAKANGFSDPALLETAKAELEKVDSDWGIDFFTLKLSIPLSEYVRRGNAIAAFEDVLSDSASRITKHLSEQRLSSVTISPDLDSIKNPRSGDGPLVATIDEVARIWKEGHFRLFISHSSAQKAVAGELSQILLRRNVHGFVAHDSIEPSRAWQSEIGLALASCHAIVYLSTDEANDSHWCQQEIGWGLGRGVLVQTGILNADPKGFIGGLQAIQTRENDLLEFADSPVKIFIRNDKSERYMQTPLASRLVAAGTGNLVAVILDLLDMFSTLSTETMDQLELARTKNPAISQNPQLQGRLETMLAWHGYTWPSADPTTTIRQNDDYDPFAD